MSRNNLKYMKSTNKLITFNIEFLKVLFISCIIIIFYNACNNSIVKLNEEAVNGIPVENISYKYQKDTLPYLDKVNLVIEKGNKTRKSIVLQLSPIL